MFFKTLATASCVSLLAASAAASPCFVDAYTPPNVSQRLVADLATDGIAALPASIRVAAMPIDRATLVRGGVIIGQLGVVDDVRNGHAALTAYDAVGAALLTVRDDFVTACRETQDRPSGGTCRQISVTTSLMPAGVDGTPPLLLQVPFGEDEAAYFVQGRQAYFGTFQNAYAQVLGWLRVTLLHTTLIETPVTATPSAAVFWSLAGEPGLVPYLTGLTLTANAAGVVVISGTVPSSAAFDIIVQRLIGAGLPFDPEMVIDTRTLGPVGPDPVVLGCPIG